MNCIQKYKELSRLNNRKTNNSTLKWTKQVNTHFSKDIWMVNRHMKRPSKSLVNRQMQIKTTVIGNHTPIKRQKAKEQQPENIKNWCWGTVGMLTHHQGECEMVQPHWKTVWQFLCVCVCVCYQEMFLFCLQYLFVNCTKSCFVFAI